MSSIVHFLAVLVAFNGFSVVYAQQAVPDEPRTESHAPLETPVRVSDLLARYRAALESSRSCILRSTTTEIYDNSYNGQHPGRPKHHSGYHERHTFTDFRFDGDRYSLRTQCWGEISIGIPPIVSPENPLYASFHYTGQDSYQHQRNNAPDSADMVILYRDEKRIQEERPLLGNKYMGRNMLGYLGGDDGRIDEIIATASSASVREELETVNGSPCYVVEARAKGGQYTVWLDPEHGYNVARAKIVRHEGDIHMGGVVPARPGAVHVLSLDVTRFEEVDGVWMPMEFSATENDDFANGDAGRYTVQHKVTEVLLNPDHDALRSFLPHDVRDGAEVVVKGLPQIRYIWRNGELINAQGAVVSLTP